MLRDGTFYQPQWTNQPLYRCAVRAPNSWPVPVAFEAGLIISMERINHILHIDAVNRLAEVQAGVINGVLNEVVRDYGLFFAPDPASSETSTIGGNIATTAGDS